MAKKKTSAKKNTEQLRKEAVATIDARIKGDASQPEIGRKAKGGKATKTEKAPKEKKVRKLSGLDLAAKVLAEVKEPLKAKTIAERVIAAGWKTSGATPHATLYAAMIREIKAKVKDARFEKVNRGQFQLRKGA